jgi:hypothetical protein
MVTRALTVLDGGAAPEDPPMKRGAEKEEAMREIATPTAHTTRKPRSPRYALTLNGQPVQPASAYRDSILDQARHTAFSQPNTIARVTDTRTGTWWEYRREASETSCTSHCGREQAAA